uniref:Uncharacterized protein n=1 Tax=Anguilla anguilla TaxID=7936 RepID=A0A0E9VEK5_ANGAN
MLWTSSVCLAKASVCQALSGAWSPPHHRGCWLYCMRGSSLGQ